MMSRNKTIKINHNPAKSDGGLAQDVSRAFLDSMLLLQNKFSRRTSPLPLNQFATLFVLLNEHAASITDIAHYLNISKQQMTTIIERLVQNHLVEKQPSETDRRCVIITMTPDGKKIIDDQFDSMRKIFADHLHKLSEGEVKDLHGIIQKYNAYIQKMFP